MLAIGDGGDAGDRHAVLPWAHGFAPRLPPIELETRRLGDVEAAGNGRCEQAVVGTSDGSAASAASRERVGCERFCGLRRRQRDPKTVQWREAETG